MTCQLCGSDCVGKFCKACGRDQHREDSLETDETPTEDLLVYECSTCGKTYRAECLGACPFCDSHRARCLGEAGDVEVAA